MASPIDVIFDDSDGDGDPDYPEWLWRILFWLEVIEWLERRLAPTFYRVGIWTIRWSFAVIFIWFGLLKLYAPPPVTAEFTLALDILPLGFPLMLGVWEVIIGVCFLHKDWMRIGMYQLKFLHMPGTFIPLFLLPDAAFVSFPLLPALPALYILKNLMFVGAGLVLWAHHSADEPDYTRPPTQQP